MPHNEVEQFLADTNTDPTKTDVLEAPLNQEEPKVGDEQPEPKDSDEFQPRNRRERRLMQRLQSERESASYLAGRLAARSEAERLLAEEADYIKGLDGIYGTDTPEKQLATDLLKKAVTGARDDAEQRAYERIMQEREQESALVGEAESELDDMIEDIETEYGVNLSAAQERAYFQLMERMSPKDREGNVVEYADPHAVWEVFSERLHRPTQSSTRAKDLSSRSMVNSGPSTDSGPGQQDAMARFLHEQGII